MTKAAAARETTSGSSLLGAVTRVAEDAPRGRTARRRSRRPVARATRDDPCACWMSILSADGDSTTFEWRTAPRAARREPASAMRRSAAGRPLRPRWLISSFSSLPGLKYGTFFGGTSTLSPVFGLRPLRGSRLPQAEAAEPAQLDLLAPVQRVDDALEHRVDDDLGVLLGQVGDPRDFLDELRLRHAACVHESVLSRRSSVGSPSVVSLGRQSQSSV